jgi:CheY-like chemotaxis protein
VVKVDRGQIEQVLLNLYMNAWQAMPGGGELRIITANTIIDERKIRGREAKPGRYVKTSVIDQGIGMNEKTMQKIFDPFFTTKEMGRGTGMGLASAYGIIQNHGGFFDVQSQVGKGTTMSFFLPSSNDAVIQEQVHEPDQMLTGSGTILLVDDEDIILDVASEILESLGYTVITARSGQEAIDFYSNERTKVDLVILDLIMPGLNGRKTYDQLNEINPEIKVLLSSGYSLSGEASSILERGRVSFIQKPYNINDLSKKVREVLG